MTRNYNFLRTSQPNDVGLLTPSNICILVRRQQATHDSYAQKTILAFMIVIITRAANVQFCCHLLAINKDCVGDSKCKSVAL